MTRCTITESSVTGNRGRGSGMVVRVKDEGAADGAEAQGWRWLRGAGIRGVGSRGAVTREAENHGWNRGSGMVQRLRDAGQVKGRGERQTVRRLVMMSGYVSKNGQQNEKSRWSGPKVNSGAKILVSLT